MDRELFSKIFQTSPDAILITRLRDGRFVEVNEAFTRLFGYAREKVLSNTTIQSEVWLSLENRDKAIALLRKGRHLHDHAIDFRTKNGRVISCLVSGELFQYEGEEHGLWVIHDNTESKTMEKVLQLRLMLWEYAGTHTLIELMQKALDEIENLTGSQIGFYHFVDEDENNLSLQAWSTRTLTEFCKMETSERHYPIDSAGVWVDCVHQRKPVIHNDYLSLPHRRGIPDGHAFLARELVAPTIRNGKIVSILGVGNKPTNYDRKDVGLVSYISDLVWQIIEQKRLDEQMRLLNMQLKYLAMTDELTSLTNRRSFFLQGEKEVKRTQRSNTPLSLLMLDVDGFKSINDRYGHEVGDLILQRIGKILVANVREIDMVSRMGGEEFSILLPDTKAEEAVILAERLRAAVEQARFPYIDHTTKVTMSIGVSTFQEGNTDLDSMLRNADAAMYQAKNEGRNKVVLLA